MSETHVYPTAKVAGDYLRCVLGLTVTAIPVSQLPASSWGFYVLAGLAVLFAGLGLHTWCRHRSRLTVDEDRIELRPGARTLRWSELRRVDLAYFSTRSDRRNGWMQLTLKSVSTTLRLDSRLSGFADVVRQAAETAYQRGLEISPATATNLEALGIRSPHARVVEGQGSA